MGRQAALLQNLPPLGVPLAVAAAYISLSPGKFMDLVNRGLMPKPKRIGGRLVWDLEEVRLHFKALPNEGDVVVEDRSWSDVDVA